MFLTIVTRCCQRPKMLSENIQSVIDQTCHDVEQVFIVDHTRQGIHVADRALALNKDRVEGEYVYILDDDCQLIDN
ncbi:MAG: glycosyltransferase family 2 protein, partial [Candidatus Thorarchaeota archaeon]